MLLARKGDEHVRPEGLERPLLEAGALRDLLLQVDPRIEQALERRVREEVLVVLVQLIDLRLAERLQRLVLRRPVPVVKDGEGL